jgi:hypothetical protein
MLIFVLLAINGIRGRKYTRLSGKGSIGKRLSGLLRRNNLNHKNKTKNLLTGCSGGGTQVDNPDTCYSLYTAILGALGEIPGASRKLSVAKENGFPKNRQMQAIIKKGSINGIDTNSRMKKKVLGDDWGDFPTECAATYCQEGCEIYYDEADVDELTEDDINAFTAVCAVDAPVVVPPGGGGEQPPAGGGEQPPAGGGEQPPAGGGEQPPAGGGEQPPAGGGEDAPGDDETAKKDADIRRFMIGRFLIFTNLMMVVFYFIF